MKLCFNLDDYGDGDEKGDWGDDSKNDDAGGRNKQSLLRWPNAVLPLPDPTWSFISTQGIVNIRKNIYIGEKAGLY